MRVFNYSAIRERKWDSEILGLVAAIYKEAGKQELYLKQRPEELEKLVEIAKVQSTEASNAIEGIVTTNTRIRQLVEEKTTPRNRDEQEIAGYRDVLNLIHENFDAIPITQNYILQLHKILYSHMNNPMAGRTKNVQNYISATYPDGHVETLFTPQMCIRDRANVGAPQVAYKETIKKAVDQDTKYARQSGGKGQYGHVKIHVEPNESGKGYEFVNAIVGGAVPKEYIPAVDAGIQGAMNAGVVAGFPVVDVKVTLYDGSYHEVDSSEMAFKIAGSMAFKEACRKADPTLLEPIMKVSVIVPDEYMGDVIGDLNSRRGQIIQLEARPGAQQIDAYVPLAEMFGYATDLRSRTQGRGQYTMEPSHYVEIPKNIRDKIVETRTKSNG